MADPPPESHPFASLIGLEFTDLSAGTSECRVDVADELLNPHGVVHGAVLYALADTGMGGALYPLLGDDEMCATSQLSISYSAPVRSGTVACKTRVIHRGRRMATLESVIENDDRVAATALGTFAVFPKRA